jgi:hypothetical protein
MASISRNQASGKTLKVILGDGYDPITELTHPSKIFPVDTVTYPSALKSTERRIIWRRYEYVRIKTSNQYPDLLLYYLIRLAAERIISTVITTNYDCYWSSIKARNASSEIKIVINPIPAEAHISDHYYESVSSSSSPGTLSVHMIHGRLGFARFSCKYRTQLPNFVTDFYHPDLIKSEPYVTNLQHWCPPGTDPCGKPGFYWHDLDWLNDDHRDPYTPEIRTACSSLEDRSTTAGILVIGFSGYYNDKDANERRNEEIVPVLERILEDGAIPIYVVYTKSQWDRMVKRGLSNYLAGRINGKPNAHIERLLPGERVSNWLARYLEKYRGIIGISPTGWKLRHRREWYTPKMFVKREVFWAHTP